MMRKGQTNSGSFKKVMLPWNKKESKGLCKICGKELPQANIYYCSHECQWKDTEFVNKAKAIGRMIGKLSSPTKGNHKPHSEEAKKRISESKKGILPKSYFALENYRRLHGIWNKGLPSEEQSRWMGGLSLEYYPKEFNSKFKRLIKIRDGFICIKCGMKEEDSITLFKRKLDVHHINYDKQLVMPENCCTLCIRCHIESNTNRESWTKFYQSLLSERYGYEYSSNGEMMKNIMSGGIQ